MGIGIPLPLVIAWALEDVSSLPQRRHRHLHVILRDDTVPLGGQPVSSKILPALLPAACFVRPSNSAGRHTRALSSLRCTPRSLRLVD